MKKSVILEIQHAVNSETPRGVGVYAANLVKVLLRRGEFEYGLSYFKKGREEIDRAAMAKRLFPGYPLHEISGLDYSDALRYDEVYSGKSYEEYVGASADLFHFMNIISIPTRINGKMVVTIHDLNWIYHQEACSDAIKELAQIGWRRVKSMRPILLANSLHTKNEVLENSNLSEEDVHVVYHSFDKEHCFPEKNTVRLRGLGIEGDFIFFVGVFERKKNIERIVGMFDVLADKYKGLSLVLAGKPTWDNADEIYASINSSRFRERIKLLGYVSNDDKRLFYSHASCFVFPSICEGFGVPVIEAFACGCPVVTSNTSALPETAGGAAALTNPLDIEEMVFVTERILTDSAMRQDLIEKGFERAKVFDWEKTAIQTEAVYRAILAPN